MTPFHVHDVPIDARETDEPVGSKRKFWFTRDNWPWLFKASRPNTGEDWAEVVAAELCEMLGLPHATYELAIWNDLRGIATPNFLPSEDHGLVLGNEVMAGYVEGYPKDARRPELHTLEAVLGALAAIEVLPPIGMSIPDGVTTAGDVLLGYFLFDAWIGNADRHHENWGLIKPRADRPSLAPTFDHASSMGRELRDAERQERMRTKDRNRTVDAYASRCESALFASAHDRKPLKTRAVAQLAFSGFPTAARAWIMRIATLDDVRIAGVFERIPPTWISDDAKAFALTLLACNRDALVQLVKDHDG